jgi:Domain of unknown function (DUF1844)
VATEHESDPTSFGGVPLGDDDFPPIDFCTFIVSLRASAMLHLAAAGEPDALAFARQEIDLLGILQEKTRGNLSTDEQLLLSEILFDLRTRYLAARTGG